MTTSALPSAYVDLATFDELETYLYGGLDATTYFVRGTKKATWFSLIPVPLSILNGTPGFNSQWAAKVSRGGDYLLHSWIRLLLSSVSINVAGNAFGANGRLRWCSNFMHNLLKECSITFNDIVKCKFSNYFLDFNAAFTVPGGKQIGYHNMIGNVAVLTNPMAVSAAGGITLPSRPCNLPLPLPHTKDTGVALPTAALPYNEMAVNLTFRDWTELLILDNIVTGAAQPATASDIVAAPSMSQVAVWATYAIVSNHERKKMGKHVRDILVEQVQEAPVQNFDPVNAPSPNYVVHFSHAVKVLFFAVANVTNLNERSNYTTAQPVASGTGINYSLTYSVDPIDNFTLLYENTARLNALPIDYFSLVNPFYHAVSIPFETGYHMYSYSVFFPSHNPMGSTNFGKLTGVTANPVASASATSSVSAPAGIANGQAVAQVYKFVLIALSNNVIRIAGGALGFPVL